MQVALRSLVYVHVFLQQKQVTMIGLLLIFWLMLPNDAHSAMPKQGENMPKHNNALIHEPSPYLQQHAHNPVDWYPWGEEAFAKAKRENKPIFLSIGYSTCHWCHVMERESFEDEEVAAAMNATFIAIKVDREERPDIDQVYMQVAQMMNGSGGWPLNILMTPEKKPFYAATYLPKHSRNQRMGMLDLSARVHVLWTEHREELEKSADEINVLLRQRSDVNKEIKDLDVKQLTQQALQDLEQSFDAHYGGFGSAPKFPSPHKLLFLLRQAKVSGDAGLLGMVEKTLDAMRAGGVFDQVGFGFHRYSTDDFWLLPHFEKMLYDQAMLMMAYTEAYQATGHARHATVVREIAEYVLRDMTDITGGFYSAEDADSEGVEGKFYVWDKHEIKQVLGKEDAELASTTYHLKEEGNFHDEATGRKTGENIPYISAHTWQSQQNGHEEKLEAIRKKLFVTREKRIHPFKDDKILTDWNGLMIAALAKASAALDEDKYLAAAQKSADFILKTMKNKHGKLLHRYRHGDAAIAAHLDDYAYMVWGLIELYQAGFDSHYLAEALQLNQQMMTDFGAEQGGFYLTSHDAEVLPVRSFDGWDGALPSGNAVAAMNMLKLARMSGDNKLEDAANKVFSAFSSLITQVPAGFMHMLSAFNMAIGDGFEIVLAGDKQSKSGQDLLKVLRTSYVPYSIVVWRDEASMKLIPFIKFQTPLANQATVYVCKNFQCNQPVTDSKAMLNLLQFDPAKE